MKSLRVTIPLVGLVTLLLAMTLGQGQPATETLFLSGVGKDDGVPWNFNCTAGRNSGFWTTISVPSCWEIKGFGSYNYGNESLAAQSSEQGIYSRTFTVPAVWSGRRIDLVFDGVMTDAAVKINGTSAGLVHQGAFTPFRYTISPLLHYGGSNTIEVTVSKKSANASVNEAERTADYWIFGGIFRPVYLEARPAESIQRTALNPQDNGVLSGTIILNGLASSAQVLGSLRTPGGALVGTLDPIFVSAGQTTAAFSGSFSGVVPWSMENPVLYDLTLDLVRSGSLIHTVNQRIGFRTVQVIAGDGLYLNGVKIRLKGVNRHTFWPDSGRTSSPALSAADVRLIKGMNMNAVRMSHYPPDSHFLDTCDAQGLLVLDELPGWSYVTYDNATAARLVQEMVRRDVNHPSVILWANGNEGGWNTTVDENFALDDPQARTVLHPGSNWGGNLVQGGIDTTHYPTYAQLTAKLSGANLFLPTEFLHGLYDGGHGAGLQDYWNAMRASPRGVGGFLWAFADEGVVRADQSGILDTAGNQAPDGILGPYHEKEPSYDAIRDIWSPVQVTTAPVLNEEFNGEISVFNDYYFINLNQCTFRWEFLDFPLLADTGVNGVDVVHTGTLAGPSMGPQTGGTITLPLPANWRQRDALRLVATGPGGEKLRSWTWTIRTPTALLNDNLPVASGQATLTDAGASWSLNASGVNVAVNKSTGRLESATVDGISTGLTNGPRIVAGTSALSTISARQEGADAVVETVHVGNLSSVLYRMRPSGALEISYAFRLTGIFANIGLTFDYPAATVTGFRWLGDGPQPVWRNRAAGVELAVWEKATNNAIPGQSWTTDPIFRGFHSNFYWGTVKTTGATVSMLTDTTGLFFRLLTPAPGADPRFATFSPPAGELSLLHGVSAHGSKFDTAASTGPSGQLNSAAGNYSGRFFLIFHAANVPLSVSDVSADGPYRIRVTFSRPLAAEAFLPASYELSPAIRIHAVTQESPTTALLDIEPLHEGLEYTLNISSSLTDTGGEVLTGSTAFPVSYRSGLAAHWPFDSATSGVSPDLSGNNRSATLDRTTIAPGHLVKAMDVSGTPGSNASFLAPVLAQFTISAWVRLDTSGTSAYPRIVSLGADNVQFFIDCSGASPAIGFNVKGKGDWRSTSGIFSAFGTWIHLAVTYDSESSSAPLLYLNGVAQTIASLSASAGTYGTSGFSAIGNRNTDGLRPWDGAIDDLRIWERVLAPVEIAGLASQPGTKTFSQWMAAYPSVDPLWGGDPDYDGVPTAIEWISSRRPDVAEGSLSILPMMEVGHLVFHYSVPKTFGGPPPAVQASTTLATGSWQRVDPSQVSPWRDLGDRIEYRVAVPTSGDSPLFLRLLLTEQPD